MTDRLGWLLWWKVGDVDVTYEQLETASIVDLPAKPLPIDVYRRVTASAELRRDLGDGEHYLQITTMPIASSSDKMLTRHIVGTLKTHVGQQVHARKVGDIAFYKPPRGQNHKARMRVSVTPPVEDGAHWAEHVRDFADMLKYEYDQGVKGALDGQAVRRLVRAHLAKYGALYLDGPYFVKDDNLEHVNAQLGPLFGLLGEDSFMTSVPLPDGKQYRAFLVRGLERAVKQGVEIDETIWKVVEQ